MCLETAVSVFHYLEEHFFDKENTSSLSEYSVPRCIMYENYYLDTSKLHRFCDILIHFDMCNTLKI